MITYPVDVDNTTWAIHDSNTGEIVRNRAWPVADGEAVPGLDSNLTFLKHTESAKPTPNPLTQQLLATEVIDLAGNELRIDWSRVPISNVGKREGERSGMRDRWASLSPPIRGPYKNQFEAAGVLLDEGDDAAAVELIDSVEPTTKIRNDSNLLTEFNNAKAAFATGIANLTPI